MSNPPKAVPHVTPLTRHSNWRVVIEPRRLGDYGYVRTSDSFLRTEEDIAKDYRERCEGIADDVKRHVDNVAYVGVESDTESLCPYCRGAWMPEEHGFNGCCDEEVTLWKAAHKDDPNLIRRVLGDDVILPSD